MHTPGHKSAPPQAVRASTLIGTPVLNRQGQGVGKIHEVMFDLDSGRVTYAVLTFGGLLGVGNKLFAVPWPSLRLDLSAGHFVLDVDKDKLARAPGFDEDEWPNMSDRYWGTDVHKFYDTPPA